MLFQMVSTVAPRRMLPTALARSMWICTSRVATLPRMVGVNPRPQFHRQDNCRDDRLPFTGSSNRKHAAPPPFRCHMPTHRSPLFARIASPRRSWRAPDALVPAARCPRVSLTSVKLAAPRLRTARVVGDPVRRAAPTARSCHALVTLVASSGPLGQRTRRPCAPRVRFPAPVIVRRRAAAQRPGATARRPRVQAGRARGWTR